MEQLEVNDQTDFSKPASVEVMACLHGLLWNFQVEPEFKLDYK